MHIVYNRKTIFHSKLQEFQVKSFVCAGKTFQMVQYLLRSRTSALGNASAEWGWGKAEYKLQADAGFVRRLRCDNMCRAEGKINDSVCSIKPDKIPNEIPDNTYL
jgi:hypothetical protein